MLKKQSNSSIYTLSLILLIGLHFIAINFISSNLSYIFGSFTMVYLSISIMLSVMFSLNKNNPVIGTMVLATKAPITILIIYILYQSGHFETFSFILGILIVLPSLVILSYRKSIN